MWFSVKTLFAHLHGITFQYKNNPKLNNKRYLERTRDDDELQLFQWPSRSPDRKLIENILAVMDKHAQNR